MSRPLSTRIARFAALSLLGAGGTGLSDNGPTTTPVMTRVVINISEVALTSLGDIVTLIAQASDVSGNTVSGKTFTWTSSNAEVATVSTTGLVTAVANGSVTVTAATDGVNGTATVVVDQAGGTVDVTPTADTLTALGQTTQLAAAAKDALGYAVTGATFTWQSSDTVVATVDTTGLVTSVGNGSATITATSGSVAGTASVAVQQVAVSISLSPDSIVLVEPVICRLSGVQTSTKWSGSFVCLDERLPWSSISPVPVR